MDISYLRSFCTAVKFKSISAAAKYLHLTQPGLSMQLQSLENEMGTRFLKRSNKGVELTKEGKVLYEYAATVIRLSDKLKSDLNDINSKSNLPICACDSICENNILNNIYKFKEINPNINITMEVHTFKDVIKKLMQHEANLAILMKSNIPKSLSSRPIIHDKLILVGGQKDIVKETIDIDELTLIPIILREESSGILPLLENALDKKNLTLSDLNVVISLNSPDFIKSSVLDGKGYSFFPESAVEHELNTGEFKEIHINDFDIPFDYCIAFRNSYTLTGTEKKLVRFFSTDKKNL